MLRKLLATSALCLVALTGAAKADGFYAGSGGTGYFVSTSARPCTGQTSGQCTYVAAFVYGSSGSPVLLTGTSSDVDSTHSSGGLLRFTFPDAFNGSVTVNNGAPSSIVRHTIETGRPGGAFNTIRTDLYSVIGSSAPTWAFEVQGSTLMGVRFFGPTWQVTSGALVLDTEHATSSYRGVLLSCTSGPVCSPSQTISISFPRNNVATVTYADGTTESLSTLAY